MIKGEEEETISPTYEGEWKEGLRCGIGRQEYPGTGNYYGYWQNDQRHGEGVMKYDHTTGDVYSGNWANGQKDGKGTYVFEKTGQKYVGHFSQGQMVSGKWLLPNGTCF